MIRIILSMFIPFRLFIEKMDADFNQFILILKLKLTLENRNSKSIYGKNENTLLKQSLTQIVLGILLALLWYKIRSPFTFYYFTHSFIMAMMAMMIISEFTTILFDTSENAIIQPLPVKGNTVSLARNAHVFVYLALTAFNLSVLSIILVFFKFGFVSGILFVITIILNVMFTLFLANILYLGIMRMATGEKLKNLLMYFQIVIAILFMAGYQFGIKVVDSNAIQDMIVPIHWYTFLIPPAFFSGLVEALSTLNFDLPHLILTFEGLVLPFAVLYFTGRYLTPVFNRKLMDLEQGDRNSKVKTEVSGKSLWYRLISFLFVFSSEEKASFKLIWKMSGRERLFIQTLLPSLGYVVIMIVLPFFNNPGSISDLALTDKYLFILYAFLFVAATLPAALLTGNNKGAAWIYRSIPLGSPAVFFKGCIKAAFARFFIPLYSGVGIVVCSVWGLKVLPDVITALLAIYFFTLLFYYLQRPFFPFSVEKIASNSGESFLRSLLIIVIAIGLGFMHKFLLLWDSSASYMLIPLYIGSTLYVDRIMVSRKITWKEVDALNSY